MQQLAIRVMWLRRIEKKPKLCRHGIAPQWRVKLRGEKSGKMKNATELRVEMSKGTYIEELQTWKQRVEEVMKEMVKLDRQIEIAKTERDLRHNGRVMRKCISRSG